MFKPLKKPARMRSSCRPDRGLVEYALRLPLRYNLARRLGKAMLRRALPKWVPETIRWGDKRGFTPPMASWLRTALRPQMAAILEDSKTYLPELLPGAGSRGVSGTSCRCGPC